MVHRQHKSQAKNARPRPYECNRCHHTCIRPGELEVHHRSHTKETPFLCDRCGVRFTTKSNLTRHKKGLKHRRQLELSDLASIFSPNLRSDNVAYSPTPSDSSISTSNSMSPIMVAHPIPEPLQFFQVNSIGPGPLPIDEALSPSPFQLALCNNVVGADRFDLRDSSPQSLDLMAALDSSPIAHHMLQQESIDTLSYQNQFTPNLGVNPLYAIGGHSSPYVEENESLYYNPDRDVRSLAGPLHAPSPIRYSNPINFSVLQWETVDPEVHIPKSYYTKEQSQYIAPHVQGNFSQSLPHRAPNNHPLSNFAAAWPLDRVSPSVIPHPDTSEMASSLTSRVSFHSVAPATMQNFTCNHSCSSPGAYIVWGSEGTQYIRDPIEQVMNPPESR